MKIKKYFMIYRIHDSAIKKKTRFVKIFGFFFIFLVYTVIPYVLHEIKNKLYSNGKTIFDVTYKHPDLKHSPFELNTSINIA